MSLLEFVLVLNTDPRFCTQRRREAREEKMKTLYTVIHIFHVAFCKFQIAAFAMICFFLSVVSVCLLSIDKEFLLLEKISSPI